ncbi:hypothetical protein ACFL1V_08640, partial [Pseudomonadota bacterium]
DKINDVDGTVCDEFPNSDACREDRCLAGVCEVDLGPAPNCSTADGSCYDAACNTDSGLCTDKINDVDGTVCDEFPNSDACREDRCLAGVCEVDLGPAPNCSTADGECFDVSCNTVSGFCTDITNVVDGTDCVDADGNACTDAACVSGACKQDYEVETCDAEGICYYCDSSDGDCKEIPPSSAPDECVSGTAICRTPGFWGARGGYEGDGTNLKNGKPFYRHGQNVTGETLCNSLVDLVDGECLFEDHGLKVCGNWITNTKLDDPQSATEAICIKGGDPRAKMLRMLMSASLNCELGDCDATTRDFIEMCNEACWYEEDQYYSMCHDALGCFNEGGTILDENGTCVQGGTTACEFAGNDCDTEAQCAFGERCVMFDDCHLEEACPDDNDGDPINSDLCFEPLGAASSPGKCNAARQTTDYIFNLPGWVDPPPSP